MPPALDLAAERALQMLMVKLADARVIRSANDCSDGGLAVALAECCFDTSGIGAEASIAAVDAGRDPHMNVAAALFGESASRVLVSLNTDVVAEVLEQAAAAQVPARVIGQTGGNRLHIAVGGETAIDLSVDDAERVWASAVSRYFKKHAA
jgi:phosphoribosylformylglycinamidine synthase subunit PurL